MKERISTFLSCMKKLRSDMQILRKGQKPSYELLQLSHRLEKGLLIENPKPMWGWDKASRIIKLMQNADDFSRITANAVLSAYLVSKSKSQFQEDREKYAEFVFATGYQTVVNKNLGGTLIIGKPDFTTEERETIHRFFNTRHSCREFANRHVSDEDIKEAVQMALRCPSACNRQPFHVYVIEPNKLAGQLSRKHLQYKGDRTLIITGDVRAFTSGELLDWIVSPSIFVGYLTLSLHSLGIGSCVVRKDLIKSSGYNDAIRSITCMEDSECVILELFIGYYKDEFEVPVSNRKTADDVIKFV